MARDFTKNTANYMNIGTEVAVALVSGASAVSIAAWVYYDTISNADNNNRIFTAIIDGVNGGIMLATGASGANNLVRVGGRSQSADGFQAVNGTTNIPTGQWIHMGGVLNIGGDVIRVYYNGTQEASTAVTFGAATYTDNGAPTKQDAIGGYQDPPTVTAVQIDGRIAELGLWAGDIGTAGFEQLNDGFSPLMVRPDLLVAYWPLIGNNSPETDIVSAKNGTITGTIAKDVHPRIIYPSPAQMRRFTTAAVQAAAAQGAWKSLLGVGL